jgi:hypothetical protein
MSFAAENPRFDVRLRDINTYPNRSRLLKRQDWNIDPTRLEYRSED